MTTYIVAADDNWDGTLNPCFISTSLSEAKSYIKNSFFLGETVVIYKAEPFAKRAAMASKFVFL